ncbi:hypothetical protein DSS19_25480, partial [Salmonella enterica subsp. enterica serovar Abony]|nr:hypothetical protein [Salmonella enterica subsp. enterica serovar Abony]
VPDTVKVCLRRQPTTTASGTGCRDLQPLGAGGADPWPRVSVSVDIPKLTVYIGPIWDDGEARPDTGFARDPDKALLYGDAGCAVLHQSIAFDGYAYRYTSKVLGIAPTPLTGTPIRRSDYDFAPGEVFRGAWVKDGTVAQYASSPAGWDSHGSIVHWADPTQAVATGASYDHELTAALALAPVSAPNDDVNYVAGWRHGTSDHSVAMINVKAGATAGVAMTQPNGAGWAAGG